MYKLIDIVTNILDEYKTIGSIRLHHILYYVQANWLVKNSQPLFEEEIEAWVNGPIIPVLFDMHKGIYTLKKGFFKRDSKAISEEDSHTLYSILDYYLELSPQTLKDVIQSEDPWRLAREGLLGDERGNHIITNKALFDYYCSRPFWE